MSAIALPLLKFSDSTTPDQVVPVEQVSAINKFDLPHTPPRPGEFKEYKLIFSLTGNDNTQKEISISFLESGDRDDALSNLLTASATAI